MVMRKGKKLLLPLNTQLMTLQNKMIPQPMSDIAQVQLGAKLVVLSCCHSGTGQIRSDGAVGIARALILRIRCSLGVGGTVGPTRECNRTVHRSRFYEHLVRDVSASKSVHKAKWMRRNGYSHVAYRAPFLLMGDNVTFEFAGKTMNMVLMVSRINITSISFHENSVY